VKIGQDTSHASENEYPSFDCSKPMSKRRIYIKSPGQRELFSNDSPSKTNLG